MSSRSVRPLRQNSQAVRKPIIERMTSAQRRPSPAHAGAQHVADDADAQGGEAQPEQVGKKQQHGGIGRAHVARRHRVGGCKCGAIPDEDNEPVNADQQQRHDRVIDQHGGYEDRDSHDSCNRRNANIIACVAAAETVRQRAAEPDAKRAAQAIAHPEHDPQQTDRAQIVTQPLAQAGGVGFEFLRVVAQIERSQEWGIAELDKHLEYLRDGHEAVASFDHRYLSVAIKLGAASRTCAAATSRRLRGSIRVKAARAAKARPGAPASRNAVRQP